MDLRRRAENLMLLSRWGIVTGDTEALDEAIRIAHHDTGFTEVNDCVIVKFARRGVTSPFDFYAAPLRALPCRCPECSRLAF